MDRFARVCLPISILFIAFDFILQTVMMIETSGDLTFYSVTSYVCLLLFFPTFFYFAYKLHEQHKEILQQNTYLEHAAKILRHDMHSGINTYIPRGVKGLKRRISQDEIKRLNIEYSLRLLEEGLRHTQKVYDGVREFTNLVKKGAVLDKKECDLKETLSSYLDLTAYSDQVHIAELIKIEINAPLFCTAIDNFIRNGLKYNDSDTKFVKIYMIDDKHLAITDNGRGMSQREFEVNCRPYYRDYHQKETGTGLGLSISMAILNEHGFSVSIKRPDIGTTIQVRIK